MKIKVRHGVFETNSSSTHSLTLGDGEGKPSFTVASKEAKLVFLFGLIDNAEAVACRSDVWREAVLRFREQVLTAYGDLTEKTREEVLREINYTAFGNLELRRVLGDREGLLSYVKEDAAFAACYAKDRNRDILAFAEEYFIRTCEQTRQLMEGRIRCDAYFERGCLIECDCGFESYRKMAKQFSLDRRDTDGELYQKACAYLSDACVITAREYQGGFYPEETGERY